MEETRIDMELERLRKRLPFLWEDYGFHLRYFSRDHYGRGGRGFFIGLENKLCRLVFEKDSKSEFEPIRDHVGKKNSIFNPSNHGYFVKDGWQSLTGLIYWLTGVQCESVRDVDKDLENLSQYLKLYMDQLLELFNPPEEFDSRLEQLRNKNKDNQLTVDKIKAERARLQALGQDSSLEAAINSLRGGKK
jgi:hypothetical protein